MNICREHVYIFDNQQKQKRKINTTTEKLWHVIWGTSSVTIRHNDKQSNVNVNTIKSKAMFTNKIEAQAQRYKASRIKTFRILRKTPKHKRNTDAKISEKISKRVISNICAFIDTGNESFMRSSPYFSLFVASILFVEWEKKLSIFIISNFR